MSDLFILLGYPGTGKYTVASALVAELNSRGRVTKVVDNHYVNNPIFGVMSDGTKTLPVEVWELIDQVRDAVLTAIERHGPSAWTYVFTNYISADEAREPKVQAYVERLKRLAGSRGGVLHVITLTCDPEELCRRVVQPERRERQKSVDANWVRELTIGRGLYEPAGEHTWTLDITHVGPTDTALAIADRAANVG
jgi:hypothetical protein